MFIFLLLYKKPNPEKTLPVMVWIHGGGWMMGNGGTEFYGPSYFLDRNVVLVTINYRLGAIGTLISSYNKSPFWSSACA